LCYNGRCPLNFNKISKASRAGQKRLAGQILDSVGNPWSKACNAQKRAQIIPHCVNHFAITGCKNDKTVLTDEVDAEVGTLLANSPPIPENT